MTFEFFQYIERLLCYSQFSNSTSDNGALLAAKGANIRAIPGCTTGVYHTLQEEECMIHIRGVY